MMKILHLSKQLLLSQPTNSPDSPVPSLTPLANPSSNETRRLKRSEPRNKRKKRRKRTMNSLKRLEGTKRRVLRLTGDREGRLGEGKVRQKDLSELEGKRNIIL